MALIYNNNNDNDGEDDNEMFYVQNSMKFEQLKTKLRKKSSSFVLN